MLNGAGRSLAADQPLELWPVVAGGGDAGVDEGLDKLMPLRDAPGFALPTLVGDGHVMFGLPGRGDAQIERDPLGRAVVGKGHGFDSLTGSIAPKSSSKTSLK